MDHRLFVYGTLRKHGSASNLMKSAIIVKELVFVRGMKIYDRGTYPIALDGYGKHNQVVGDIYQVDEQLLLSLDNYEGDEYYRRKIMAIDCWVYLGKYKSDIEKMPLIKSGNWIDYVSGQ